MVSFNLRRSDGVRLEICFAPKGRTLREGHFERYVCMYMKEARKIRMLSRVSPAPAPVVIGQTDGPNQDG